MIIESQRKFDAYLLTELPELSKNGDFFFPIGFKANWRSSEQFGRLKSEIESLFEEEPKSQIALAHWPSTWLIRTSYLTAQVNIALLMKLNGIESISEIQLCANPANRRPIVGRSDNNKSETTLPPVCSNKTILALVDHGCPFAHRAILKSDGKTAIHAIWDQDTSPDFPEHQGTIPRGFGYGRQITRETLNSWIKKSTHDGLVDETACYQLAKYDAMRTVASHGSIVLGHLARDRISGQPQAVRESALPHSTEVDYIFVQLPRSVPLAPTRGSVERCMLDGVRYILNCAPKGANVSVVLDYGTEMGPHDGSSWFESALDQIVILAKEENDITLKPAFCSGNSFEEARNLIVRPSNIPIGQANSLSFNWHVPRGCDIPSALEIWMSDQTPVTLCISNPGKKSTLTVDLSQENLIYWTPTLNKELVECVLVAKKIGNQIQVLISVPPTRFDRKEVMGSPGCWEIQFDWLEGTLPKDIFVNTQWAGKNIGFQKRATPPRFSAKSADLTSGAIRLNGDGSTWGSACGKYTYVAGGYEEWGNKDRAFYSSAGTSRDGKIRPTMLFATEEFASLGGILGIGHRSPILIRARGTSFAAPQLARHLVNTDYQNLTELRQKSQKSRTTGFVKKRLINDGLRF
jgi:hypothetical protein